MTLNYLLNNMNSSTFVPVFYRTYSNDTPDGGKETWEETCNRVTDFLAEKGQFEEHEKKLVLEEMLAKRATPAGRVLWCGGKEWAEDPRHYYGLFNCSHIYLDSLEDMPLAFRLLMQGCGVGMSFPISELPLTMPKLVHKKVLVIGEPGDHYVPGKNEDTVFSIEAGTVLGNEDTTKGTAPGHTIHIHIGDSAEGWAEAVSLFLCHLDHKSECDNIVIHLGWVRPANTAIKGFGGVSNPIRLGWMFETINNSLLLDECFTELDNVLTANSDVFWARLLCTIATVVVAGNVRRSSLILLVDPASPLTTIKQGMWKENNGRWEIDPNKDIFRMANITAVLTRTPDLEEVTASLNTQYSSGEGAMCYAPEMVLRVAGNPNEDIREKFKWMVESEWHQAVEWLAEQTCPADISVDVWERHLVKATGSNPCGEILGSNFLCNLSLVHLDRLDPDDDVAVFRSFRAATLVACALLGLKFPDQKFQLSREIDPIVGVCFTGVFDYFSKKHGDKWIEWWMDDRVLPEKGTSNYGEYHDLYKAEADDLSFWREIVHDVGHNYCCRTGFKMPNRWTSLQPAGSKSLLTNASPGAHPPKALYFIRRITIQAHHPVALAALDIGYNVVPSQSCQSEDGGLLDDIYDPRSTEWLIEIPVKTELADHLPEDAPIQKLPAIAQLRWLEQLQTHYVDHNTSFTLEMSPEEIPGLAEEMYGNYQDTLSHFIMTAVLARSTGNTTFPRLPFEPVSKAEYQDLVADTRPEEYERRYHYHLARNQVIEVNPGPMPCDGDKCSIGN